AKLLFSARARDNKKLVDIVTQVIPIRPFGFQERRAQTGEGNKKYTIALAKDAQSAKSQVTVSLSPTLLGMLPTAMNYLIQYPYGCVEQTTSRFVPAVIAKQNAGYFASSL